VVCSLPHSAYVADVTLVSMAETYAGGVLVLPLVSHVEYVDEASADRRADTQTPDRCFPLWRGPVRVCPNVQFYTKYAVLFLICAG